MHQLSHRLARRRFDRPTLFQNAGWCYDNYPELQPLRAHATLPIAEFEGPGVVTMIHVTRHLLERRDDASGVGRSGGALPYRDIAVTDSSVPARGVLIEVYYNGVGTPAVRCPLSDFFADGCAGRAEHFSTPFVEKLPESYNSYVPMPFEHSIRIVLVNETEMDLYSYSFVEGERLSEWDGSLLYFHATWNRQYFQLGPDTVRPMITIDSPGHLVGHHFSFAACDPIFREFYFVMEGNCEHRIDGEELPSIDYLGTEDSFALSWGFSRAFSGSASGVNYLHTSEPPYLLSAYRFRPNNALVFPQSLDVRINWQHEFTDGRRYYDSPRRVELQRQVEAGGCWLDIASTYYWYQSAVGHQHTQMPEPARRSLPSWCEVRA